MDPLAPQPSEPVVPEEDAPVIAPPVEPVSEPPGEADVPPANLDIAGASSTATTSPVSVSTPIDNVYTNANAPENVPVTPVPAMPAAPPTEAETVLPEQVDVLPVNLEATKVPSTPIPPAPAPPGQAAPPRTRADMVELGRLGLAKRRGLKETRKARLLDLIAKKGHIAVSDAELLLHVSKSTAELYLRELIAQGRIERRGRVDSTEYWWRG